ncbi:PD-(D/E)XK nuclease family protein [Mailhella sp.]
MKIILGRYMDGGAWPDAVTHFGGGLAAVDGVKVCGPMGFLSLLQEKLGLPNNIAHGSKRIAVWEGLLKQRVPEKAQEHEPFYAASFRADSWNTAKRLLQMRDELKEAGALEDAGSKADRILKLEQSAEGCQHQLPRLAEMFRLEAEHLRGESVPGPADQMRAIRDELTFQGIDSPLSGLLRVELATPLNHWQAAWHGLFDLLSSCGVAVTEHPSSTVFGDNTLKANALAESRVFTKGEHIGLEAANLPEAAEAIAAVLRSRLNDKSSEKVILLRAENSTELDGALSRYGLPSSECRNRSTARPFVQILPLYLRLQLLPFDPETLRQFLLLPVCPVEPTLRRKLLSALKYEEFAPYGEDIKTWPSSWKKAFCDEKGTPVPALQKHIDWICPKDRIKIENDNTGISPTLITSLAQKLGEWAQKTAQPPLPKTAELCQRLSEASSSISENLSPLAFEKLLDSVLGDGENNTEKRRAVPWKLISSPGQIWTELDEEDTVIWWDFTDNGQALRDSITWSNEERTWLNENGHPLFDIDKERCAQSHAMTAPFHFVRRVVTVTPRVHGSEESLPHQLHAFLPKEKTVSLEAGKVLSGEAKHEFFRIDDRVPLMPAPAPTQWKVEKGRALALPEKISPSVLESTLACPAAWYFKNMLCLDSERDRLSGDPITCGNLAHEVMEQLLKEQRDTPVERTKEELLEHISSLLDRLAQNKAARLALPEYKVQRKNMAARLTASFLEFCKRMKKEGLVFLDSEQTYKGTLGGTECTGRYDLMLGRPGDDKPAVVADMKWSRRKVYKAQAKEGNAVQLAAYHFLLEKGRKVIGWQDKQPILAPHDPVHLENAWFFLLPEARIHASEVPLDGQWKKIENGWFALCNDLSAGRLPLAEEEKGDSATSKKTENESPCLWCAYKRLCGRMQNAMDTDEESLEEQ